MAAVNTITFDKAAYGVGETITVAVNITPDTPSQVPVAGSPFTFTVDVKDGAGNTVATNTGTFPVNQQQAGDSIAVSDSGSRVWTGGAITSEADGSESQSFTATA